MIIFPKWKSVDCSGMISNESGLMFLIKKKRSKILKVRLKNII